jgi:isoleucyl-tRNA synthetase
MHRMALALTKLLAPMLVFTADEAWDHLTHRDRDDCDLPSVHLALLPQPSAMQVSDDQQAEWQLLMDLRESALGQLDKLKRDSDVKLTKALDAEMIYRVDAATKAKLSKYGSDLEDIVGAGYHSFEEGTGAASVTVVDRRGTYNACARSWKRRPDVGQDPDFADLSARDAAVVKAAK